MDGSIHLSKTKTIKSRLFIHERMNEWIVPRTNETKRPWEVSRDNNRLVKYCRFDNYSFQGLALKLNSGSAWWRWTSIFCHLKQLQKKIKNKLLPSFLAIIIASVTRWLDYVFNLGHLQQRNFDEMHILPK